jgi:hypothetical protein
LYEYIYISLTLCIEYNVVRLTIQNYIHGEVSCVFRVPVFCSENMTIKIYKILILYFAIQLRECEKLSFDEREEQGDGMIECLKKRTK